MTARPLPTNEEAEECLIGCMLLAGNAVGVTIEKNVTRDDFSNRVLAQIFDVIRACYDTDGTVDEIVVCDALEAKGILETIGGRQRIQKLMIAPMSSLNANLYAQIVLEHSALRNLIQASNQIIDMAHQRDGDVTDIVDKAEGLIFGVAERKTKDTVASSQTAALAAYDHLVNIREKKIKPGQGTGFREYDNLLMGLQPSSLYILAARPACGKTAWALNAATHIAETSGKPVMFFSLEMSSLELMNRVISSRTSISYRTLQTGQMDDELWGRVGESVNDISGIPLFIDDDPNCTILQMRAKARRHKSQYGPLSAIFIDYIQLMNTSSRAENRQVAVSELSRGLKILARELECPVIALSQLNRNLEYRADKRPMLADLRESGALEQDADVVTFLYRDEIYDPESSDRGVAEVIVAKNRRGATGTVRLAFVDRCVRFSDIAGRDF